MRDIQSETIIDRGIKADAHSAGTITGSAIDTKYARKGLIVMDFADAGAAGTMALKVTHCDSSGGTYTDVTDAVIAAKNTAGVYKLVFKNFKRYIKVVATVAGNAIDGSATVILYSLR